MPNTEIKSAQTKTNRADYEELVRFLIEPFLESPNLLSFDCEQLKTTKRVWIRLAFDDSDKGKIYGRGGRNIQAIKTVLATAANAAGETLYLEIYDGDNKRKLNLIHARSSSPRSSSDKDRQKHHSRRSVRGRTSFKARFQ
jgi:predicted RNA-binding protein YlqC (UPF0109 family)